MQAKTGNFDYLSGSITQPIQRAFPNMRAEDVIGGFIDDHLGPCDRLVVGSGREPTDHVVGADLGLVAELLRLRFSQSDAGESRNGVDAGRDGRVVGLRNRTFHDVAANDLTFVGGDRRQLRRGPKNVATDMDGRIRG